jgi:hypothetical protein
MLLWLCTEMLDVAYLGCISHLVQYVSFLKRSIYTQAVFAPRFVYKSGVEVNINGLPQECETLVHSRSFTFQFIEAFFLVFTHKDNLRRA